MLKSGRARLLLGLTVVLVVGSGSAVVAGTLDRDGAPRTPAPLALATPASPSTAASSIAVPAHPVTLLRKKSLLGHSVKGRPIRVSKIGPSSGAPTLLVVGCIHGNEPAGIAVARDLLSDPLPKRVTLWVLPDLNPDGVAAGTRQNAHGVDLNRNFPFRWRRIGRRGSTFYSGPHALSEPESRIAHALVLRVRPHVTIWFHQSDDVVDQSGGSLAIERRYARLTHMRLARLPRYPGSAAGWQNHRFPASTAFVVELPGGRLTARGVERFSDAILRLLR
jgi:murein peptide amidase A